MVAHVLDRVGVVVDAFVRPLAERVEDDPLRLGVRLTSSTMVCIETPPHLAIPGPSLDTEVLGDLLVVLERSQLRQVELNGVLDQPAYPQPVIREVAVEQRLVLIGVGVLPVVPEVR